MSIKEIKRTKTVVETVTYTVAPCIACGGEDIDIYNYEDNQGPPLRGGECKKCKKRWQETGGGDEVDAAEYWNKHNDPLMMIIEEQKKIERAQKKIAELVLINEARESKKSNETKIQPML